MNEFTISPDVVKADVLRALNEDVGSGDLTAALIPEAKQAVATVICRDAAVICGRPWVDDVLAVLVPTADVHWLVSDGARCEPNQAILKIQGPARGLLTAERVCLNFLQTLSAVATKTALYASKVVAQKPMCTTPEKPFPDCGWLKNTPCALGAGKITVWAYMTPS